MKIGQLLTLGDIIILVLLVALCALSLVWLRPRGAPAQSCVVSWSEGRVIIPLPKDTTLTLTGPVGRTTVVIDGSRVRVAQSDCRNQICVHAGVKTRTGSVIVCVPNRVVVQLIGRGGLDGITR